MDRADDLRPGIPPYHRLLLHSNSVVTRPFEAVWVPIIAVALGSAFGFKLENVRVRRALFSYPIY